MKKKIGRNDPCWCGSGKKYKQCHWAFDEKLQELADEGHPVPRRDMIKTPEQVEKIRESCRINVAVLDEIDKQMRLKGYMKPPKHNGLGTTVGPVVTTMRVGITDCWRIRRILWTGRVKPTDTYYLRIKNVLTNTEKCCLLDYLEWCPKHVYDAAVAEDEW